MNYAEFLVSKRQMGPMSGFDPIWMPEFLFDFQVALIDWAIRKGRGAIFADCGMGKTPMQLVWAENVARKTSKPVLIVAPLAVGAQTVLEAEKFGIEACVSRDGRSAGRIVVTNYERLHLFNSADFAGVVCDESSAIKSFNGKRRRLVTQFLAYVPYRLLATATASPNDYVELGTSSEALGDLPHVDMLARFFKNLQSTSTVDTKGGWGERPKWRLKGHAATSFWRWVCSWARAARKPSDLGFDDARFVLPPLVENLHIVQPRRLAGGALFELPSQGLQEQREEQRRTLEERCEKVAGLVAGTGKPAVVWCHLNAEGRLLNKLIDGSVEVRGQDSPEEKEESLLAFAAGKVRVLVIKPKIGAFGLNWQHCAHMTFFPSHSYEQYYQAVRRSWRFGQASPVVVDIVATPGGANVQKNLERKSRQADQMFSNLVTEMNHGLAIGRTATTFNKPAEVPSWLSMTK